MAGVTPSTVGKYADVSSLWTGLAYTVMHGQCTTNGVGWYAGMEITKLPMVLDDMLVHD